ncbi:hypothetical protein SAY86_005685 [Trapa natans]|uniref:DEVIL-like protein n=1 Tax=Trapa natans TaxID=22666 RepID=A0AAN7L0G0_TRANT|nr:hypothetical protein SAY86_005685 [Trapa natans]
MARHVEVERISSWRVPASMDAVKEEEEDEEEEIEPMEKASSSCEPCRSFGQKCRHMINRQRARFYIVRRCVAMLLCWHEHKDP